MVYSPTNYTTQGVRELKAKAGAVERDLKTALDTIDALQADVDRLLIVTEALWTLLKKQQKLDDKVLIELIDEIDLRDGRLDGRMTAGTAKACPACQRPVAGRRTRCVFCGAPVEVGPFER